MKKQTQKCREKMYKKALALWGIEAQINMMIEECAELIQALQKYKRNTSLKTIDNIYEELADVEIMSEQMRIVFDSNTIDATKRIKLKRLGNLLIGEETQ